MLGEVYDSNIGFMLNALYRSLFSKIASKKKKNTLLFERGVGAGTNKIFHIALSWGRLFALFLKPGAEKKYLP